MKTPAGCCGRAGCGGRGEEPPAPHAEGGTFAVVIDQDPLERLVHVVGLARDMLRHEPDPGADCRLNLVGTDITTSRYRLLLISREPLKRYRIGFLDRPSDWSAALPLRSTPFPKQVRLYEHDGRVELEIDVGLLLETMSFVPGQEEPDWTLIPAHACHYLLRFGPRHARVVSTGHDEQWLPDLFSVVERRDRGEKLGDLRIPLVTVLRPAKVAAVRFGIAKERREVRNAHDIEGAADPRVVVCGDRQRHVAAVTAARHEDARRVQLRLPSDPVEQRADVAHRILAQQPIIQFEERL